MSSFLRVTLGTGGFLEADGDQEEVDILLWQLSREPSTKGQLQEARELFCDYKESPRERLRSNMGMVGGPRAPALCPLVERTGCGNSRGRCGGHGRWWNLSRDLWGGRGNLGSKLSAEV